MYHPPFYNFNDSAYTYTAEHINGLDHIYIGVLLTEADPPK